MVCISLCARHTSPLFIFSSELSESHFSYSEPDYVVKYQPPKKIPLDTEPEVNMELDDYAEPADAEDPENKIDMETKNICSGEGSETEEQKKSSSRRLRRNKRTNSVEPNSSKEQINFRRRNNSTHV